MVWFVVYYNKNVELSARESFLEYVPLVVITFWSFPHSWLITGCVARVTRRMSLVEQELLTVPENMCSPLVLSWVRVPRSLVFCVVFCRSLFDLLSFLLAIVLSVLLRFADSDFPLVSSNSSNLKQLHSKSKRLGKHIWEKENQKG